MGAGVNRMDLIQVAGKYPPPPGDSEILGVEGNFSCMAALHLWLSNKFHLYSVDLKLFLYYVVKKL